MKNQPPQSDRPFTITVAKSVLDEYGIKFLRAMNPRVDIVVLGPDGWRRVFPVKR